MSFYVHCPTVRNIKYKQGSRFAGRYAGTSSVRWHELCYCWRMARVLVLSQSLALLSGSLEVSFFLPKIDVVVDALAVLFDFASVVPAVSGMGTLARSAVYFGGLAVDSWKSSLMKLSVARRLATSEKCLSIPVLMQHPAISTRLFSHFPG